MLRLMTMSMTEKGHQQEEEAWQPEQQQARLCHQYNAVMQKD